MENKTLPKRNTFALGVFFLTLSNVLTKFCGLFLRVPLTNLLGDSGMAYFNLAYAVYKWFYMIATAGLPVAAAILTARYAAEAGEGSVRSDTLRCVRNVTLCAFCAIGIAGSLTMYVGAPLFASLQHVPAVSTAIAAVAPALFFICIASALRGWYQGLDHLLPASVSQVVEACIKMMAGLLFSAYALKCGYPLYVVAAYAIAGLGIGSFAGMLVMLAALPFVSRTAGISVFRKRTTRETDGSGLRVMLRDLLRIAVPVTLSASVMSLCDMLDSMIVIRRMCDAGVGEADALRLYGNYTALCVPMFNLPPILIYPVTTALIPRITAAQTAEHGHEKRDAIIKTSLAAIGWIAFPCAAGMSVLAEPLLSLLYRDDLAATGAPLLRILALAVVFLSLLAMTNAILQSLDCAKYAVYSICAGACVKLLASWLLTGTEGIGILGTPISTLLCYAVMALCNLVFVIRKTKIVLHPFVLFWKPALSSVFCAVTALSADVLLHPRTAEFAATVMSVLIGFVSYFCMMIVLRGFDLEMLSFLFQRKRRGWANKLG